MVGWLLVKFLSANARRRLGFILLDFSLIGWPASLMLTNEPPVILSLSWFALTMTAFDIVATTDVRKNDADKEEDDGDE